MSTMTRSVSAPLRCNRYNSVLESALISVGREDAVVYSTRKLRKKHWRGNAFNSPNERVDKRLNSVKSCINFGKKTQKNEKNAPENDENDPFVDLILFKSHQKTKNQEQETDKNNHVVKTRRALSCDVVATRNGHKEEEKKRKYVHNALEMVEKTGEKKVMRTKTKMRQWQTVAMMDRMGNDKEDSGMMHEKRYQKILKTSDDRSSGNQSKQAAAALKHWYVEWPPLLKQKNENDGTKKAVLVIQGQVNGKWKRFVVGKREGATKFISRDGKHVVLSGKMDRKAAKSAGMSCAAMELMDVGIPAYFSKRLLPYAQKMCDNVKHDKMGKSRLETKKKTISAADTDCLPVSLIHEKAKHGTRAISALALIQDDEAYSFPKHKKVCQIRASAAVKEKRKGVKKEEPEAEGEVWTIEQQEALQDAKLKIPTTAPNFWAQVAQYVSGKSAQDCQAKTFEHFRSPPTTRKLAKKPMKRAKTDSHSAVPTKIARAGSNKFKKQVREFVEEYEKKHVDDLFETTPSKEGLPELPEFDAIKSPELGTSSCSVDDNDSEMDDKAPGLLAKLSARRRDDIDSYVLGINRRHVAGGGVMAGGKVRRLTSMVTPVKAAKTKAPSVKKKAVMLVEEIGSHSLKGVVSPGGSAYVRVEKDGSSSEGEEDDCRSSESGEEFDLS